MHSRIARAFSTSLWTNFGFAAVCAASAVGCGSAADGQAATSATAQAAVPSDEPVATTSAALTAESGPVLEVSRAVISGDVFRYTFILRVGDSPNARLHITRVVRERAPFLPRATTSAVMMLHGDFATFNSNFAPTVGAPAGSAAPEGGLGVYLAKRDIDVWGVDRRWTNANVEASATSDFAGMTFAQELSDIGRALAFARLTRGATGSGLGRITLAGFSRGGQLAYEYVAGETQKPAATRHVAALVPIDVYAKISPADETYRQNACASAAYEKDAVANGTFDSDNSFQITVGTLAATAPGDITPYKDFLGEITNHDALVGFLGQTYYFFTPTPVYHLGGTVITDGTPKAMRFSAEPVVERWLASAPYHQALAESADGDAIWCGDAPRPVADHIADIRVPLYYLGAAGGFGDHGLYTTSLVASTDVTTHVVRQLPVAQEAEDYGHGDLLYASTAPTLAWKGLATWLSHH